MSVWYRETAGTALLLSSLSVGINAEKSRSSRDVELFSKALYWQQILDENPWLTKLKIAENEEINRAAVYLHFNLLKLPGEILDFIRGLEEPEDQSYFTERLLRPLLKLRREEQFREFEKICTIWRRFQARQQRKKSCKT